jgi:hypothetical protein
MIFFRKMALKVFTRYTVYIFEWLMSKHYSIFLTFVIVTNLHSLAQEKQMMDVLYFGKTNCRFPLPLNDLDN